MDRRSRLWLAPAILGLTLVVTGSSQAAPPEKKPIGDSADDEALLEFHFTPVGDLQIAIWLEDAEGNFVADVFVTQATGKLGIGNRPGSFLFLSSWREPYGPRESVLPVWAHRRGKTYPKIVFHDPNPLHAESLGFHEATSSPETYFCRPLTPLEDAKIQTVDIMSCPSPSSFSSDKGQFGDGLSVYPPRNDLTEFEEDDHPTDPQMYAALNDLDAVTRATPMAGPYSVALRVRRGDMPEGPLVAWIEASLEWDENADWRFDRERDHWVDPNLPTYGREFLGQPAVVYRLEFDPAVKGFETTMDYAGYSHWEGLDGTLNPPDGSISEGWGKGADRLQVREMFGQSGRFGVYSHGYGEGGCIDLELPPVENLRVQATAFDTVTATFTLPADLPLGTVLSQTLAWSSP